MFRSLCICLLFSLTLYVNADEQKPAGLSTWQEAVITTQDPQPWLALLTEFADWEVLSKHSMEPAILQAWGLADDASGQATVLANPNTERGFIRLIELTGVEQQWNRVDDRPWDTGGFFDLNIRVKNLKQSHAKLHALGWQGDSKPNDVIFGPYEVVEWIARGPDGVRFAFIERIKPILEGYEFTRLSRVFNSTQTVADIDASLKFYRDILGMSIKLEHNAASKEQGPNVLGLPHEATAEIPRVVYILNGEDATEGQIELLAFDGATGRDLSANAQPYNIGLSVLRYQVEELDALIAVLNKRGLGFEHPPIEANLPPYGSVRLTAFRAPEGAYIELFERLDP